MIMMNHGVLFLPARWLSARRWWVFVALIAGVPGTHGQPVERVAEPGVTFFTDRQPRGPWTIQVIKVERARTNLFFTTTLGRGRVVGLATPGEQIASIPRALGLPVAAVNGDFYRTSRESLPGDPRGLQIIEGELVSDPAGDAAFWITADGQPRMAEVESRFRVVWPDGTSVPFGLNEERSPAEAVLFTRRFGPSTLTGPGGLEIVLEPAGPESAGPLRIGVTNAFRVRSVEPAGNTALTASNLVLSLGSTLARRLPALTRDTVLQLSTATTPTLTGATVAVGGGPLMIADGQLTGLDAVKSDQRHPRTAFGWSDAHYFFVQVDGRQAHSDGMAIPELARYLHRLGCRFAMNLDGGASSTIWLRGRVLNSPSSGRERDIGNCLVLVRRDEAAPPRDPKPE